jgi:hypothetical protein
MTTYEHARLADRARGGADGSGLVDDTGYPVPVESWDRIVSDVAGRDALAECAGAEDAVKEPSDQYNADLNYILPTCDARAGYRVGIISCMAWQEDLEPSYGLMQLVRSAPGIEHLIPIFERWKEVRASWDKQKTHAKPGAAS